MRIYPADHDVHAVGASGVGGLQHGVGFAYASHGAKEDLQFTAGLLGLFRLDTGEQGVGVGPLIVHRMLCAPPGQLRLIQRQVQCEDVEARFS